VGNSGKKKTLFGEGEPGKFPKEPLLRRYPNIPGNPFPVTPLWKIANLNREEKKGLGPLKTQFIEYFGSKTISERNRETKGNHLKFSKELRRRQKSCVEGCLKKKPVDYDDID